MLVTRSAEVENKSGTYKRNNLCWFRSEFVRKLFVEVDQVGDVDITIVFLQKGIFAKLITKESLANVG